jgi:hypothetical protein
VPGAPAAAVGSVRARRALRRCGRALNLGVRPMRLAVLPLAIVASSCSFLGVLAGPDDFCRSMLEDTPSLLDRDIEQELARKPPSGHLTESFSPELWNKAWNERIWGTWEIGPDSCNGSYAGPTGPEMIRAALSKRRAYGLPEVVLEERNADKPL